MSSHHTDLGRVIRHALTGKGAHVEAGDVFAGLDWKVAGARPGSFPHSLYQLLNHMIYWQDWVVKWIEGKTPPIPKHASGSWPGATAPTSREQWEQAVRHFRQGLDELDRRFRDAEFRLPKRRKKSPLEMLQTLGAHNSYHAGQVALLRQILGNWPPPSGGLTW